MNISFVILHYQNNTDTIACVNSLLSLNEQNKINIIVVDNASPNKKFNEIKDAFKNINNIHFIESAENLGFAKGNNLGFMFAKNNLNPDIIIFLNADVYIEDKDFISKLEKEYHEKKFDIGSPLIYSNQEHRLQGYDNRRNYNKKSQIIKEIRINKIKIFLTQIGMFYPIKRIVTLHKKTITDDCSPGQYDENNFQVHGCFIVFGPKYIQQYNGICDKTFMYGEESILKYISVRDGLKMCLLPSLLIFHSEQGSSEDVYSKNHLLYRLSNINKSAEILLEIINEDEKRGVKIYE